MLAIASRKGMKGLGDQGVGIPFGFVGNWTPPSSYGTLVSSPINLTKEDWANPLASQQGQPVYWAFATTKGQQYGGHDFWPWGTDVTTNPGVANDCGPLYAPGYNEPKTGPSFSVGNALVSTNYNPPNSMIFKCTPGVAAPLVPIHNSSSGVTPTLTVKTPTVVSPQTTIVEHSNVPAGSTPAMNSNDNTGTTSTLPVAGMDLTSILMLGAVGLGIFLIAKI